MPEEPMESLARREVEARRRIEEQAAGPLVRGDLVRRKRPPLMEVAAVDGAFVDCKWHDETTGEDYEGRFSASDLDLVGRPRLASRRADAGPPG